MSTWTIVADDLTGAADAAASYGGTHTSAVVLDIEAAWPEAEILAVNTESRYLPEDEAAAAVAYTVRRALGLGLGNRVFKKLDSLLRGNVGAEVAAALAEVDPLGHGLAIVAPAFPATGRTTVDGVVIVDGLANTSGPFEGDVAQALAHGGLEVEHLPATGGPPAELARRFREIQRRGVNAVVVDASCDADLEAIILAMDLVGFPTLLVGSGGLARHIAPHRTTTEPARVAYPGISRVLVVIGSYSPLARAQLRALVDDGLRHVMLDHADLEGARVSAELAGAIADGDVVLTPDPAASLNKEQAHLVARSLAAAAVAVIDECDAVVLTGGETARAVMNALELTHLTVLGEVEPGVVVNRLTEGLPLLITKAGAFGDPGTLVRTIKSMRETTTEMSLR